MRVLQRERERERERERVVGGDRNTGSLLTLSSLSHPFSLTLSLFLSNSFCSTLHSNGRHEVMTIKVPCDTIQQQLNPNNQLNCMMCRRIGLYEYLHDHIFTSVLITGYIRSGQFVKRLILQKYYSLKLI